MASTSSIPRADVAAEPSRILLETALVQVGQFRCPTHHPRFHDSGPTKAYCFVFPRSAVWIHHEGRAPFVADSTIVPLYNPGHPYRRRPISRDGDRTDWFGVGATVLRDALAAHGVPAAEADRALFQQGFSRATARMFVRQRRVFEHVRASADPDTFYVEEAVLTLLDEVVSGTRADREPTGPAAARQRSASEETRAHLNRSYAAREDLTTLAQAVGASVFHLCRIFKQHTGRTIHAYRGQLRLLRSLELLGDSDDILSIALALGYSGHSHFTSAFHEQFGMTPSAYRRSSRRARLGCEVQSSRHKEVRRLKRP